MTSSTPRVAPTRPLALGPTFQPPRFRSAAVRARLLGMALAVSVLLAAARTAVLLIPSVVQNRPELEGNALVTGLLDTLEALTWGSLAVAAVTWVLWVAWTSRLEQNVPALGVPEGSIGPRGAILWWLVPGFNLLVPFGQLHSLDRRLAEGEQRSHGALLATWWVGFLVSGAAVIATTISLGSPDGADAATAAVFLRAALASLAWMVAGLLTLRVVRQVQRDEDLRSAVIRRGWRRGAPSWPAPSAGGSATAGMAAIPGAVSVPYPGAVAVPYPRAPSGARPLPGPRPVPDARPAPGTAATYRPVPGATMSRPPAPGAAYGQRRQAPRARGGMGGIIAILVIAGVAAGAIGELRRLNNAGGGGSLPVVTAPGSLPPPATLPPLATPAQATAMATVVPTPVPSRSPRASSAPTLAPTANDSPGSSGAGAALLMSHLTIGDGACAAVDAAALPSGSLAAISCQPGNTAVVTLQYALYPSADEAEAAYLQDLAASGVTPGTGNCFDAVAGESNYSTNHTPRGRVFCALDGTRQTPTMAWFDRTLAIIGRATGAGTALKPLCDWWVNESGPA